MISSSSREQEEREATAAFCSAQCALCVLYLHRFLVGNDFLPHLPSLDIGEHAFDRLFDLYKTQITTWSAGAYLTDGGEIADANRLQAYLAQVRDARALLSVR